MKTKNKMLALFEIAIVLCSVFLVALPAIAAEQNQEMQEVSASEITTASEDDFVLDIYGNANEDDTIDMRDLTYVKLIFFGKKPETELADAKYDGKINPLDFIQIKLIIVGKEKEITIVDSADRVVTVEKPVERIIPLSITHAEPIRVLGAEDNVVGVGNYVVANEIQFPVMSKQPTFGSAWSPDFEKIIELNPDIVLQYVTWVPELEEKLEPAGINIIRLGLSNPENVIEEFKKLGYILDKKEEAEEFINWYENIISEIEDRTEGLSEVDKPRVYLELYPEFYEYYTMGSGSSGDQQCKIAGGINIAGDIIGGAVEPEWVVAQNPEIIIQIVTGEPTFPSGYGVDDITEMKTMWKDTRNRPELQSCPAVTNENIYVVAEGIRCTIEMVICVAYWAKMFHPDLFENFDPKAIHQEYLTRFLRIDYDLDEHGVFVYPPLE